MEKKSLLQVPYISEIIPIIVLVVGAALYLEGHDAKADKRISLLEVNVKHLEREAGHLEQRLELLEQKAYQRPTCCAKQT